MNICEASGASGVESWVGGVGRDNTSDSDEVFKSRPDEDSIRESSKTLWLSVGSSAVELLAGRVRLSATTDGCIR